MNFFKYIIVPFKWLGSLIMKWSHKAFGWMSNGFAVIFLLAAQFALIAGVLKIIPNNAIAMAIAAWAITMVSTVTIGIKPITYFITRFNRSEIEKEFRDKLEVERMINEIIGKKKELESEILDLKGEVAKRDSELETLRQTQYLVTSYKSSRDLQLLTVSKSGHIVKEEALYPLKKTKNKKGVEVFNGNFPKVHRTLKSDRDLQENDNWRVFYSDNTLYKYGVGIKLNDICYAIDSNVIYFKNVKIVRLNRQIDDGGDYDPNENLTNHVWIVKRDELGNYTIINNQQHNDFKKDYKGYQRAMTNDTIKTAIDNRCKDFTKGLHKILESKYGDSIHFVNDDENVDYLEWKTLYEGSTSKDVRAFTNDLNLAFDAMQLCADNELFLDKPLIPEQTSA